MSSPKPVYLVSPWKGRVVTEHPSSEHSGVVMEHAGFKDAEQKWIAEFGEGPDTVALTSVPNNKYLTPSSKKYESRGGTGEKTWWKFSHDEVRIPGAFSLSVAGAREDSVLAYVNMDGTSSMVMLQGWEVCFRFLSCGRLIACADNFHCREFISDTGQHGGSQILMALPCPLT